MNKEFMAKLILNRIVDTRKYRYYLTDTGRRLVVERIPASAIGTICEREVVCEILVRKLCMKF